MIINILQQQKDFYKTHQTKSYTYRMDALLRLKKAILSHQDAIIDALKQDLNKSPFETYMTEIGVTLLELNHSIKHLKKWMKPKKIKTPLTLFKAKSFLYAEPYGNVLIMSPWNYPFQLTIAPLIGAITGGNTAILKVSPDAPFTAEVMKHLIEEAFDSKEVAVVLGDLEVSKQVLAQRYDYIFFTGSTQVGKIVMQQASKHLTPVTLELGGKSPVIIDQSADLKLAAKRIAFGKIINSGQTCIAPDYVYIHASLKDDFVRLFEETLKTISTKDLTNYEDYPKIINQKHYQRLIKMLEHQNILLGGTFKNQKIEPTLIGQLDLHHPLMQDEIFGPLLPLITYTSIEEVFMDLKDKEKPLALYLFTKDKHLKNKVINELSFGGATINDTIMHVSNFNLPFGGVGYSGQGGYHGYYSFKTFTHEKAVLDRANWIDLNFRYHPYSDKKKKMIKRFLK